MSPRSLYNSNFAIYIYNRTTCKYYCLFKRLTITIYKIHKELVGIHYLLYLLVIQSFIEDQYRKHGEVMPRQTCFGQMPQYG